MENRSKNYHLLLCPLSFNFAFQFRDKALKLEFLSRITGLAYFLKNIIRNLTVIPILS